MNSYTEFHNDTTVYYYNVKLIILFTNFIMFLEKIINFKVSDIIILPKKNTYNASVAEIIQ